MPLQVLRQLRKSASQMAYNSLLYNWSLRGSVPDRLVVKPVDPWPGDAEAGRSLCGPPSPEHGFGAAGGDQIDLCDEVGRAEDFTGAGCWEPVGIDRAWLEHMHGFTWLRDLRALGGAAARKAARDMIESWAGRYSGWHAMAWHPGITGERVAMWIALYEVFGASASEGFQDIFFESVIRQARHLSRALPGDAEGIDALKAIKGLLYAGLAFEGCEAWIEQALDALKTEIEKQILGDGAHVSRSPAQLLQALQILLDVRMALSAGGYPLPEKIQHAIDRMGPALRFFRYADKHFALFNGTQEGPKNGGQDFVDCVLGQANVRGKNLQSLPCAGYERMSMGRTLVMFDCGRSPDFPYDVRAHAAPLAFEVSYAKERLFVSCGTHPDSEQWQETLRATAAHNTASIDYRNACEIREDGHMARKVRNVVPLREESKEAMLLESSHDGYVPLNGITHRRRLYLSGKGHDLRGEDIFTSSIGSGITHDVAIRFHIHPRVMVSLVRDGQDALLRLPSGIGWRFHHTGGVLALEDSIYLGEGSRPRKTKQLVIYGQMSEDIAQIKWAVQREG